MINYQYRPEDNILEYSCLFSFDVELGWNLILNVWIALLPFIHGGGQPAKIDMVFLLSI